MKKLRFIPLIAVMFLMVSCTTVPHKIEITQIPDKGYSYEGMVDPYVIQETWASTITVTYGYGTYRGQYGFLTEIFYKNPDGGGKGEPRVASLLIFYTQKGPDIIAYTYLYSGEPYMFVKDKKGCFKNDELDEQTEKAIKQALLNALNGAES